MYSPHYTEREARSLGLCTTVSPVDDFKDAGFPVQWALARIWRAGAVLKGPGRKTRVFTSPACWLCGEGRSRCFHISGRTRPFVSVVRN